MIEMIQPMIRPYSCAPLARADSLVMRTFSSILSIRDGIKMFDEGGSRSLSRCCMRLMGTEMWKGNGLQSH